MKLDRQVNLWEQAQNARSTANWSLLLQCLQQLILEEGGEGQEAEVQRGRGAEERIDVDSPQLPSSPAPQQSKLTTEKRSESVSQQAKLLDWAMDVLTLGDFHQRWDIAKLFPKLGQTAYALLIEFLEDEDADEELRWFAARILGKFNHPEAIAALVELLKTSESEELQAMAAAALSEIGASAVAAITELLAEENTRWLAVRSLCYIRRQETITPLLSVVQDPQIEIRAAAIEALSSFHDPRIPPVLLNALNDIAAPVRREAAIGLGFRPDLREELDLIQHLLPRLYDFNLDVCAAAAGALGRLGTDAAATGLYHTLQSPHTPVSLQIEIVRALGRVKTETSLEYLSSALHQLEMVTVWQEIVTVLGQIEQAELKAKAAEILIQLLRAAHPATQHARIKQAIALSLGHLGERQALKELIQLLADPDASVRLHAIAALKQVAPIAAHQQLAQMATDATLVPQLKQGVEFALQEWNN